MVSDDKDEEPLFQHNKNPYLRPALEPVDRIVAEPILFNPPVRRLIWMGLLTFGIFEIYWMYKNWRYLNKRDNFGIRPIWRAIFSVFFCHALLRKIYSNPEAAAIKEADFNRRFLATMWVVVLVVGNLLGLFDDPFVSVMGFLVALTSVFFLVPVQRYINIVNRDARPPRGYSGWSLGHVICLLITVGFWVLAFFFV